MAPAPLSIEKASSYVAALRSAHVLVDPAERKQVMVERLAAAAQSIVGSLEQAGSACTEHIDPCAAEDPC